MKDINLYHGFKGDKKPFNIKQNSRKALFVIGGVVALMILIFVGIIIINSVLTNKTADMKVEAQKYSQVQELKNASAEKADQIATVEKLLKTASATSYVGSDFLWTVSSTLDQNTFLTNLAINENGTISFAGKSATRKNITYYIYTLKKTLLFSDVTVNIVSTEPTASANSVYSFTGTAILKGGVVNE